MSAKTKAAKAEAIAAADAAEMARIQVELSNSLAAKAEAIAIAADMGTLAAQGAVQLTDLAFAFNVNCRERVMSADADADKVYLAYARAFNLANELRAIGRADPLPTDPEGSKSNVSAFRTFGKKWVVAQGENWFARISEVRERDLIAEQRKSEYTSFLAANREVQKLLAAAEKAGEDAAALAITDEMIAKWIAKKAAAGKDDIARMRELIAKLAKFAEGDYGAIEPMLASLRDQIAFYEKFGVLAGPTIVVGRREESEEMEDAA